MGDYETVWREIDESLRDVALVVFEDRIDKSDIEDAVYILREYAFNGWQNYGLGYAKAWDVLTACKDNVWELLEIVADRHDMSVMGFISADNISSINDLAEHMVGYAMEEAARRIADVIEARFVELGLDYADYTDF